VKKKVLMEEIEIKSSNKSSQSKREVEAYEAAAGSSSFLRVLEKMTIFNFRKNHLLIPTLTFSEEELNLFYKSGICKSEENRKIVLNTDIYSNEHQRFVLNRDYETFAFNICLKDLRIQVFRQIIYLLKYIQNTSQLSYDENNNQNINYLENVLYNLLKEPSWVSCFTGCAGQVDDRNLLFFETLAAFPNSAECRVNELIWKDGVHGVKKLVIDSFIFNHLIDVDKDTDPRNLFPIVQRQQYSKSSTYYRNYSVIDKEKDKGDSMFNHCNYYQGTSKHSSFLLAQSFMLGRYSSYPLSPFSNVFRIKPLLLEENISLKEKESKITNVTKLLKSFKQGQESGYNHYISTLTNLLVSLKHCQFIPPIAKLVAEYSFHFSN
jgi:hypothetical protein